MSLSFHAMLISCQAMPDSFPEMPFLYQGLASTVCRERVGKKKPLVVGAGSSRCESTLTND